MTLWYMTFIIAFFSVSAEGRAPENGSHVWNHQKLYKDLMRDYMKNVRPATNSSMSLPVHVALYFTSFNDLNEEKETLSTTAWLRMVWVDYQLKWDPKDYGFITEIEFPVTDLWYPDIYIDNTKDASDFHTTQMAVVNHAGQVMWAQIINLRTHCAIDLSHFPYDTHNCSVYLSSWAYDKQKLMLISDPENSTACPPMSGNDWIVSDCLLRQFEVRYPTGDDTHTIYPVITYSLYVSRISGFATHLFVAPSVALCLITPVIFVLPPGSQEKITFGIGVLISDVLLLGELIRFIPTAYPTMPLVGKYFLANIVMASLSLLVSALVVNIWNRRSTRVNGPPQIISRVLLDYVGKLLFVTPDHFTESLDDDVKDQREEISMTPDTENLQQFPIDSNSGSSRLRQAQNYVRKIVRLQWHQLAVVIDRIFLIIYLLILLILTFMFAQYM